MTGSGEAPAVAVVIPCYNGATYLSATVRSVLAQDGVAFEVIVVDDGSTDTSAEVAAALAADDRRLRLLRRTNGGVANARNAGLAEVSDSVAWVLFLDADDIMRPDALRRLTDALEQRADAPAAAGRCERIDAAGELAEVAPAHLEAHEVTDRRVLRVQPTDELTYRNLLASNAITTPGQCLVRRSALTDPVFDPRFAPCADWDLWLRLTSAGPIALVDDVVLQYRHHASGMSKQYDAMRRDRMGVLSAQRALAPDDATRSLVDVAFWFVRFGFDRQLDVRWAGAAFRRRDVRGCARFAGRAARLTVGEWVERVRHRRSPWWERLGRSDTPGLAA